MGLLFWKCTVVYCSSSAVIITWRWDENWRGDWVKHLNVPCSCEKNGESVFLNFPKDSMTNNNSQQTTGFQSLANIQTQTSTKRGQGLQVLVHSFSRNIGILIHVYLSLNLAAASALHSKIHLISQICCDVSKTLTLVDRSTKNLPSFVRVVWSVNHESFTISGNGRPCLTRSDAVLRWSSVVKPVNMNQTSSLSENSLK